MHGLIEELGSGAHSHFTPCKENPPKAPKCLPGAPANVLDRIELRPASIERQLFPHISADSTLYALTLPGYRMHVGQNMDYLVGLNLHLASTTS